MTARNDLERRLAELYTTEPFSRAPDRVLQTALDTIDITRQRRLVLPAPRRFPTMNAFLKLAMAATTVIVIGVLGLAVLGPPGPSNVGGPPAATPTPTISPTPSPSPSPSPVAPAALTETFTSTRYGYSVSYPAGWVTQAATEQWTTAFPPFRDPAGDFLYHPVLLDHLFLVAVSRPLGGQDGAQWAAEWLEAMRAAGGECELPLEPTTIDGAPAVLCSGYATAATWTGERGYVISLLVSPDDPEVGAGYDRDYFLEILATMQLHPEDAIDPSGSPSASPSSSG